MIDLHTHSNISDGDLSPADLIRAAADRGLSVIALTDHDTIKGLNSARNEAAVRGVGFIPGIEIEITEKTNPPPGEFHLLGLGLRTPSPAFLSAVETLGRFREERNREILDKMREAGIDASYEELKAFSVGHSIGRPHVASLLVSRRIARNQKQAFARYLGKGKRFYVPKIGLEFDAAAALIRESEGIPVLAHPMSLYLSWSRLAGFIKNLAERGLMGIEAWHSMAKVKACGRLEALAVSLGLFVTAGSDFHGSVRPERKLGHTAGGRNIDEAILEAIPPLAAYRPIPTRLP
jgi:predicted metal-dependent phosphoesterase TrpH